MSRCNKTFTAYVEEVNIVVDQSGCPVPSAGMSSVSFRRVSMETLSVETTVSEMDQRSQQVDMIA